MKQPGFIALDYGAPHDDQRSEFPTVAHSWKSHFHTSENESTFYGFVQGTECWLNWRGRKFPLYNGMYFCVPGAFSIAGSFGMVIERRGVRGVFTTGGPIEPWGRLNYIDGCTDSLLIPPVIFGDPCLNALYFPPNIDQTQHTHPSIRCGIIVRGRGQCITPDGETDLVPDMLFVIPKDGVHRFRTPYGQPMTVIAYHPDSDFGPKHQEHPMINRTIVGGVSAAQLPDIQTKPTS